MQSRVLMSIWRRGRKEEIIVGVERGWLSWLDNGRGRGRSVATSEVVVGFGTTIWSGLKWPRLKGLGVCRV